MLAQGTGLLGSEGWAPTRHSHEHHGTESSFFCLLLVLLLYGTLQSSARYRKRESFLVNNLAFFVKKNKYVLSVHVRSLPLLPCWQGEANPLPLVCTEADFNYDFLKAQQGPKWPREFNTPWLFKWYKGQTRRPARTKVVKQQSAPLLCILLLFFLNGTALKIKSSKQFKITFFASLDMKERSLMWSQTFSNTSREQGLVKPGEARARPVSLLVGSQLSPKHKWTAFIKSANSSKSSPLPLLLGKNLSSPLRVFLTKCQIS